MLKSNQFMTIYSHILKESVSSELKIKSEIIKNIFGYDVNFIEFEDGKWNYQLNQKYNIDAESDDSYWDYWVPELSAMDPSLFYNSLEEAKTDAEADIENQKVWGMIK